MHYEVKPANIIMLPAPRVWGIKRYDARRSDVCRV